MDTLHASMVRSANILIRNQILSSILTGVCDLSEHNVLCTSQWCAPVGFCGFSRLQTMQAGCLDFGKTENFLTKKCCVTWIGKGL